MAGKIFLPEARKIVGSADEARATMINLSKGQSGYLAIAFNEPAINTFLPKTGQQFAGHQDFCFMAS